MFDLFPLASLTALSTLCLMGCGGHLSLGDQGGTAGEGGSASLIAFGDGGGRSNGGGPSGGGGSRGGDGALLESCDSLQVQGLIAFDSDRADFNRDIYLVRPDGSELTRLTDDPGIDREPAFSPDGARIAFTSTRAGVEQVFLLDVKSKQVAQVTERLEGASQASFSRDGRLIAFHSGRSLYVVGVDGEGERLVATANDDAHAWYWPQFSADDSELIFDGDNRIDAVKLDGASQRSIVSNFSTTIKAPAVSSAGAEVAYHVACDGPRLSVWTTPAAVVTDDSRPLVPRKPASPPGVLAN